MIDFASFSGFGDAVDNSECWSPVISYVESQYEAFLDAETRVNRVAKMPDSRVHACLYFIAPSGHGLKVKIGNSYLLSLVSLNEPSPETKTFYYFGFSPLMLSL